VNIVYALTMKEVRDVLGLSIDPLDLSSNLGLCEVWEGLPAENWQARGITPSRTALVVSEPGKYVWVTPDAANAFQANPKVLLFALGSRRRGEGANFPWVAPAIQSEFRLPVCKARLRALTLEEAVGEAMAYNRLRLEENRVAILHTPVAMRAQAAAEAAAAVVAV